MLNYQGPGTYLQIDNISRLHKKIINNITYTVNILNGEKNSELRKMAGGQSFVFSLEVDVQ